MNDWNQHHSLHLTSISQLDQHPLRANLFGCCYLALQNEAFSHSARLLQ